MYGDSAEAGSDVLGALFEDEGAVDDVGAPPALAEVGLCDRERKNAADCRNDSLPPVFSSRADLDPLLGRDSMGFVFCLNFPGHIFEQYEESRLNDPDS